MREGREGNDNENAQKHIANISNTDMAKEIKNFLTNDYLGEGGINGLAKVIGNG